MPTPSPWRSRLGVLPRLRAKRQSIPDGHRIVRSSGWRESSAGVLGRHVKQRPWRPAGKGMIGRAQHGGDCVSSTAIPCRLPLTEAF